MKKIITLIALVLLLQGCRTTTRTKSTAESESRAIETATQQTESAKIDSVVLSKLSEVLSKVQSQSRESETEQNLRITEIIQRETFFNEMQDLAKSGMSVHPSTGRIVETTTRIKEQQNITREKELLKNEMIISRMKSDSIALVSQFQRDLTAVHSEKMELEKRLEEFEHKEQVCFPCYLKLWWLMFLFLVLGYVIRSYWNPLGSVLAFFRKKK